MSIESLLERIAVALEKITNTTTSSTAQTVSFSVPTVNPNFVEPTTVNIVPEPTEEELRVAVREYMNKTDKNTAIELLIKYGAKREKPMIKDVINRTELMKELKNDNA